MQMHVVCNENRWTLRPEGEFTIYGAVEFRDALLKAMAGSGELDIDLSETGEIDAAGMQLLLLAAREAASGGRKLRLIAPGAAVREVIGLCNLAGRFDIAGGSAG